jgi:hypothetical protein
LLDFLRRERAATLIEEIYRRLTDNLKRSAQYVMAVACVTEADVAALSPEKTKHQSFGVTTSLLAIDKAKQLATHLETDHDVS